MRENPGFCTRNLRRLTALFVVGAILCTPVEVLIPDVHDGDASPKTTMTSHLQFQGGDADRPDAPHPSGNHAMHVDHCAHSHLISNVEASRALFAPEAVAVGFDEPTEALRSLLTAPQIRPPIA